MHFLNFWTKKKNKKKMTEKQKKGLFMKVIIIYCLGFICVTNVWSLYILRTTGYDASNIVDAINLVHGGELLFCCVKKIIDSPNNDIGQKKDTIKSKYEEILGSYNSKFNNNNYNTNYNNANNNSDEVVYNNYDFDTGDSNIIDGVEYNSDDCRGE